jgi:hypothetical protein
MKFLEERFVTQSELVKFSLNNLSNAVQIDNLTKIVNDLKESQKKLVLYDNAGTYIKKEPLVSTTEAIVYILQSENGKKLHCSDIYSKMTSYNLTNPNVTLQTVKATLYQLARQKRIVLDNGTETGMFFIEKK